MYWVELADYVIPKGCFVVPFLSAVHLDENIYKGALSFNPWRWMEPENQVHSFNLFFLVFFLDHFIDTFCVILITQKKKKKNE